MNNSGKVGTFEPPQIYFIMSSNKVVVIYVCQQCAMDIINLIL